MVILPEVLVTLESGDVVTVKGLPEDPDAADLRALLEAAHPSDPGKTYQMFAVDRLSLQQTILPLNENLPSDLSEAERRYQMFAGKEILPLTFRAEIVDWTPKRGDFVEYVGEEKLPLRRGELLEISGDDVKARFLDGAGKYLRSDRSMKKIDLKPYKYPVLKVGDTVKFCAPSKKLQYTLYDPVARGPYLFRFNYYQLAPGILGTVEEPADSDYKVRVKFTGTVAGALHQSELEPSPPQSEKCGACEDRGSGCVVM